MTQTMQKKISENKIRFLKELKDELKQENSWKEALEAVVEKPDITEEDNNRY